MPSLEKKGKQQKHESKQTNTSWPFAASCSGVDFKTKHLNLNGENVFEAFFVLVLVLVLVPVLVLVLVPVLVLVLVLAPPSRLLRLPPLSSSSSALR